MNDDPSASMPPFTAVASGGVTSRAGQIAQQLKQLIHQGALAPGQRLPTERALAGRFGVSVPTVNKAMAGLEAEGYLVRQVGTGTSVAPEAARGAILLSFHARAAENGPPFFRTLIQRLSTRIDAAGLSPELVLSPSLGRESVDRGPALRALARDRVLGVVSMGWSEELAAAAAARGVPCVTVTSGHGGRDGVRLDYAQAVTLAVAHLAAKGHRRVALLTGDPPDGYLGLGRPFAAALDANGLSGEIIPGIFTAIDAARATRRLLADPQGPRALVLTDEHLAPGIALLAEILDLRLPRDLAVVSHASLGVEPSLVDGMSVCGFPVDEIAGLLLDRCLALIRSPTTATPPTMLPAPVRLVPGAST